MRMKRSMSSALWCVSNGRATAPPTSVCIVGVSTSRKPCVVEHLARGARRCGCARGRRRRPAGWRRDRRSAGGSASRRPVRPCHFSGSGRSAFVRMRTRVRLDGELAALRGGERALGLDDVADVDVLEARVARAHRRPRCTRSWISPVRSRRRRNERPPVERNAMTRPRTWKRRGPWWRPCTLSSAYLPASSLAAAARARSSATSSVVPPRRGTTSFANGFSLRSRRRAALARRASIRACSVVPPVGSWGLDMGPGGVVGCGRGVKEGSPPTSRSAWPRWSPGAPGQDSMASAVKARGGGGPIVRGRRNPRCPRTPAAKTRSAHT